MVIDLSSRPHLVPALYELDSGLTASRAVAMRLIRRMQVGTDWDASGHALQEQWTKLLDMADELRAFIREHEGSLKTKGDESKS